MQYIFRHIFTGEMKTFKDGDSIEGYKIFASKSISIFLGKYRPQFLLTIGEVFRQWRLVEVRYNK